MKSVILPVLLQIIGMGVIIAEIFIPSMGLLSLMALGLFSYSLYIVFTSISVTAGFIFAGADIVLIPLLIIAGIKMLAKSPVSLKKELSKEDGVVSQASEMQACLGMKGVAVTDLRPAGMAQINSRRMDVVTDAEYINAGTPVIVTKVTGNSIIVEQAGQQENKQ